jgi:uncharacterized damage-inducible protein DinB
MDRLDPPFRGAERESLLAWLDYHRATLAVKCDGLTAEQLCQRSVPTTTMTLIGLVRHMADVERSWFGRCIGGLAETDAPPIFYDAETNIDGDFDDIDPATVDADMATWLAEIARSDEFLAAADLDDVRHHDRWDEDLDVRWVVVHMIEEYARHNGHADLLREAIDGATGE